MTKKLISSLLTLSLLWAVTSCTAQKQTHQNIVKVLTTTGDRLHEYLHHYLTKEQQKQQYPRYHFDAQ